MTVNGDERALVAIDRDAAVDASLYPRYRRRGEPWPSNETANETGHPQSRNGMRRHRTTQILGCPVLCRPALCRAVHRAVHSARVSRAVCVPQSHRSEEHTSELQSLMRISYAVFCLKKKNMHTQHKL